METILSAASGMASLLPTKLPKSVTNITDPVLSLFRTDVDPDACRTTPELIESRGFKSESHKVTTEDGYILTMHRIVNPFIEKQGLEAYPILLQHGIAAHSGHWLLNSDDGYLEPMVDQNDNRNKPKSKKSISNNLGFVLANMGYDVWLGNWRGNRYSGAHKKYSNNDSRFWDFSVDELIDYDLPAMLNFVLSKTTSPTLGYVGMSQGSNCMFGLLSTKVEYNDKIKPFIALAPAVKISNAIRCPVPVVKWYIPIPEFLKVPVMRMLNYGLVNTAPGAFMPHVERIVRFFGCGHMFEQQFNSIAMSLANQLYSLDVDPKRLPVYTAQANLALSKKNLAHLMQIHIYEEFARFDHGDKVNTKLYGSVDPPEYDLKAITNKYIALIYTQNDMWASVDDVDYITNKLQVPLIEDHLVPDSKWSHYDFTFGKRAGKVVNTKVIDILRKMDRKI
ncbi:Lipase member M [Halotydeus destructor]|nr:Lipase member M [Halotydeus destructor]